MKEVVATGIRCTEVAPGFVETNFARTRFRGDEEKAAAVYKGFDPREWSPAAGMVAVMTCLC
jgi:3-hydroxy acid dehydrogenase/malonic semialdehyde reductase